MRRIQIAIGAAAVLAGAGVTYLAFSSDQEDAPLAVSLAAAVVGGSFIASGLIAWRERPENRLGPVMVLIGFGWFATFLSEANAALPFALGTLVENVYLAAFVYLILSFPSGRLEHRVDRVLFIAALVLCSLEAIWLPFAQPDAVFCDGCPGNGLLITPANAYANTVLDIQRVLGVGFSLFTAGLLVRRWRATSPAERRSVAPVLWAGSALFLQLGIGVINDILGEPLGNVPDWVLAAVFAATPVAVLVVLLRQRIATGAAEAAEAERRRIERDLHDGAQQRLVSIAMTLQLAETRMAGDPAAAEPFLREARDSLKVALEELRDLSHGVHPGILSDRGLGPALEALGRSAVVPVHVNADVGRLPSAVEAAAYFVVSESLANIGKHAQAGAVSVTASRAGDRLVVEVADDGVGGASLDGGTGLQGLAERVGALGGRMTVTSPPGAGTTLRAEIPVA